MLLVDDCVNGKPKADAGHYNTHNPVATLPHVLDKTKHGEEDEEEGEGNGNSSAGEVSHC